MAKKKIGNQKLKEDYRRERRRAMSLVRKYKNAGLFFENEIIPSIPKKITQASIDRLKKINKVYLFEHAKYYITPEGEAVNPYHMGKYYKPHKETQEEKFQKIFNKAIQNAEKRVNERIAEDRKKFSDDPEIRKYQEADLRLNVARSYKRLFEADEIEKAARQIEKKQGIKAAEDFLSRLPEEIPDKDHLHSRSYIRGDIEEKLEPITVLKQDRETQAYEDIELYNKIREELGNKEAQKFLSYLSDRRREDIQTILSGGKIKEDEDDEKARGTEESDKWKTPEDVVSDEGSESRPSGNEEFSFDGAGDYTSGNPYDEAESDEDDEEYDEEETRKEPEIPERPRKSFREQIDEDYEGEKFKKWREELENQLKKKKSERDYIYEGDQAYNVLINQIKQFESAFESGNASYQFMHESNAKLMGSLLSLLEDQIARYGRDAVLARLSGKALEINNLIETMAYKYQEDASNAFSQLAFIIKGESLSAKESEYLYDAGERYASSFLYFEDEEE